MTVGRARTSPRRRVPSPRRGRLGTQAARTIIAGFGVTSWYDMRDLLTTSQQTLASRVGTTTATVGSGSGVDGNDPVRLPHTGTNFVYLPSTASNNLSVPKDGGWAGTLHVTGTLTDDSTATFTTTASPILIGDTLITAGSYRRFDIRDTDGNGTLRVTINLATETLGQGTWTCTTGQTVTVNRSATGITTAVVTRPVAVFDASDDYIQLAATDTPTGSPATTAYSVLAVIRGHTAPPATQAIWSSRSGANHGMELQLTTAATVRTSYGDGTTLVTVDRTGTAYDSAIRVIGASVGAGNLTTYSSTAGVTTGSTAAATGTPTYAPTPLLGRNAYAAASPVELEVFALLLFRGRTLTQSDMDIISAVLVGTYT